MNIIHELSSPHKGKVYSVSKSIHELLCKLSETSKTYRITKNSFFLFYYNFAKLFSEMFLNFSF